VPFEKEKSYPQQSRSGEGEETGVIGNSTPGAEGKKVRCGVSKGGKVLPIERGRREGNLTDNQL